MYPNAACIMPPWFQWKMWFATIHTIEATSGQEDMGRVEIKSNDTTVLNLTASERGASFRQPGLSFFTTQWSQPCLELRTPQSESCVVKTEVQFKQAK